MCLCYIKKALGFRLAEFTEGFHLNILLCKDGLVKYDQGNLHSPDLVIMSRPQTVNFSNACEIEIPNTQLYSFGGKISLIRAPKALEF